MADDTIPLPRPFAGSLGREIGIDDVLSGQWFPKLVLLYLRSYAARHPAGAGPAPLGSQQQRAYRAVRVACVKSALAGAAAGAMTTGATVLTAETQGAAGLIALPVAAASVCAEMLYGAFIHVELTCELARIFEIRLDPDDPTDLFRFYALAFDANEKKTTRPEKADPGHDVIKRLMALRGEDVGHHIGSGLLGDSLLQNLVPFLGIGVSSFINWRETRRLGESLRRYMRYQRALQDAFLVHIDACRAHLDLLVEGVWFVFTADGALKHEEAATLTWLLSKCDASTQAVVSRRFVEDETDWIERLAAIRPELRDTFVNALEVAAAVDKEVTVPERKLLRRVTRALGREFDMARLEGMIQKFQDVGVI